MNKTDIHPIQSDILCKLLFTKDSGFSELNTNKIPSDQFSFHLKQLTDWKYIEKNNMGRYRLTINGKEFANRFDTENKEVERQPKLGVCVVAVKNDQGVIKYLAQQRLKQPYYGFWGFVTGKIKWGEKANETASRELFEETGLTGKMKFIGLRHKTDFSEDKVLLEDKYFLTFKAKLVKGFLKETFEGGKNCWLTKEEILSKSEIFGDIREILDIVNTKTPKFEEREYIVERY